MVLKPLKISVALNIEGTIIFIDLLENPFLAHTKKMISQFYMFRKLNENNSVANLDSSNLERSQRLRTMHS